MLTTPFHKPHPTCRIICIGNVLYEPDSAGPRVFKILTDMVLPDTVELVDGGIGGLNLLACLENVKNVVFVDSIEGFLSAPGIKIFRLPNTDIEPGSYDHSAGIGYLTTMAPHVLDTEMPICHLVGIEGTADKDICLQATAVCLDIVLTSESIKLVSPKLSLS